MPTNLSSNTEYNITVKAYDNAGNVSKESMATPVKTKDSGIIPTTENDIGKYVNYQPTYGTYWEDIDENGNIGNINNFAGTAENSNNTQFSTETDLGWRIWKVDSENLYLISKRETTQKLYLKGALGYNNGVTLLDNICEKCYSNINFSGMVARHLKIEDIKSISSYLDGKGRSSQTFAGQAPYLWAQYELSDEPNNHVSEKCALTMRTTVDVTVTKPYVCSWTNDGDTYSSIKGNTKYLELTRGVTGISWLASRYHTSYNDTDSNGKTRYWWLFGLQGMSNGRATFTRPTLFYHRATSTEEATYGKALRPFVIIPLTSCKLTPSTTEGMDYDIIPK